MWESDCPGPALNLPFPLSEAPARKLGLPRVSRMAQATLDRTPPREDEFPAHFDLSGLPRTGHVPVLALVYALGLALFLSVEPTEPWVLLAVVALVGLGTDGILRSQTGAPLRGIADTAPFLFVPVLLALASGLFLEEVVRGYWTAPAVAGAGVLLAASVYAETVSVTQGRSYALGRFALHVLTYLAAFAFYAVVYNFDVDLPPSAVAVGLFSLLLAVEVFREAEADAYRALVFSAVIGIVVAEARWALYFVPLEGFLAAVVLLLVFYLATGLIQHYLTGHLNRTIGLEFTLVTAVGLAVVIAGRVLSLG